GQRLVDGGRGGDRMTASTASREHDVPLADALGQMLVAGFSGATISAELRVLIERERIGGVILFTRNIVDAGQLLALTAALQASARAAGHPRPLLIALDQEYGMVRRLDAGATAFPGNLAP